MKSLKFVWGAACVCALSGCTAPASEKAAETDEVKNPVVETIMTRRSVRKYKPRAVGRDTVQLILDCGIHAPNAVNRQAWEVRVVDNPEFIDGVTEVFRKSNPRAAEDPDFRNMFRNAPTVAFVANDTTFRYSEVDCGLLGENMMLAAWSMGVGSVCLGSPAAFLNTNPDAAEYLRRLGFSENYRLLFCVALGYPDESPAAKPRDGGKVKFID